MTALYFIATTIAPRLEREKQTGKIKHLQRKAKFVEKNWWGGLVTKSSGMVGQRGGIKKNKNISQHWQYQKEVKAACVWLVSSGDAVRRGTRVETTTAQILRVSRRCRREMKARYDHTVEILWLLLVYNGQRLTYASFCKTASDRSINNSVQCFPHHIYNTYFFCRVWKGLWNSI